MLSSPLFVWHYHKQHLLRSIELFKEIYEEKDFYFAIALLYDSGYKNEDLGNMLELIHPTREKIANQSL